LASLSAAKDMTGSNGSLIEGMLDHRLTGAMEGNVRRFAFLGERDYAVKTRPDTDRIPF